MATDPWPGLVDVDARMAVGAVDGMPNVDASFLGNTGEDVGQSDVDVTEGVFHQLAHFRRLIIREYDLAIAYALVELLRATGCVGRGTADDPGIVHQLLYRVARKHPLRAVTKLEISVRLQARLRQDLAHHIPRCSYRGGGLQNDKIAPLKNWQDRVRGAFYT